MEKLFLYSVDSRMRFGGGYLPCIRSRFIDEVPKDLMDFNQNIQSDNFESISKNTYNNVEHSFQKNDFVKHKLYGRGKVLDVEGYGDNTKVTVLFSANVKKKFIQKYANLVILSSEG